VSRETNVRQVLAKVVLGEADAGVVYRSDARAAAGKVAVVEIPADLNVTAAYPIAVLEAAPHPEAARAFVDLVRSPTGLAALREAGFVPCPRDEPGARRGAVAAGGRPALAGRARGSGRPAPLAGAPPPRGAPVRLAAAPPARRIARPAGDPGAAPQPRHQQHQPAGHPRVWDTAGLDLGPRNPPDDPGDPRLAPARDHRRASRGAAARGGRGGAPAGVRTPRSARACVGRGRDRAAVFARGRRLRADLRG